MANLVHVPHRNQLPNRMFERSGEPIAGSYARDDLDLALQAVYEEYRSYAGFPDLQRQMVANKISDIKFANEVEKAADRISGVVVESPLYDYCGITVKDETVQLTNAYKIRGAANYIFKHETIARERGVITASMGNHGQGVALAASKLGLRAVVVVPENSPRVKKEGIEQYGGEVVEKGKNYRESANHAISIATEGNGLYVPAYDHPDIMAGQGTIALEAIGQMPDMENMVVPQGGGGLLAGILKVISARAPHVRVYGAGVSGHCALSASLAADKRVTVEPPRFAEGIAVGQLGEFTWPEIRDRVANSLTISETYIRQTVGKLALSGRAVEGAGAVSIAAAISYFGHLGPRTLALASGGNIDPEVLAECRDFAGRSNAVDRPWSLCYNLR